MRCLGGLCRLIGLRCLFGGLGGRSGGGGLGRRWVPRVGRPGWWGGFEGVTRFAVWAGPIWSQAGLVGWGGEGSRGQSARCSGACAADGLSGAVGGLSVAIVRQQVGLFGFGGARLGFRL
ncbi:MAG: hypothetical protein EHM77_09125 [Planctomycetaceae bacterium]|nr:MAG: hypothetical protein EHM77_09125 [Planctomycetaceae bacterium]